MNAMIPPLVSLILTFVAGQGAAELRGVVRISPTVSSCRVGDKLLITQVISASPGVVGSVRHSVVRLGIYDRATSRLVNLDPKDFANENPADSFDDLMSTFKSAHGLALVPLAGGVGIAFEITPRVPSIYLISCVWSLRGHPDLACIPAVVAVTPQISKRGQPVLKAEWFKPATGTHLVPK